MILGIVFWGLATHLASEAEVGRTSAAIAALTLLANLAQLSFGPIFERFLPVAGEKTASFIAKAYAMTTVTALVITVVYILLGFSHTFLPPTLAWRIFFTASVMLWTIFVLQDSALVGLRAAKWIPVENISYGIAKLSLLPLFIGLIAGQGIFVVWMLPASVAVIAVAFYIFKWRIPHNQRTTVLVDELPSAWRLFSLAGAQYTSLLTTVALSSVASLIVIAKIGATANAHFFIAAQVAAGPLLLSDGIGRSFLVELSRDGDQFRHYSHVAFGALLAVVLPSVIGGYLLAPWILGLFGHTYAVHATTLLRLLLLSLPANAVLVVFTVYSWYDQRVWRLALRQLMMLAIFLLALALLIDQQGILAVGYATLIATGVQALVVLPTVVRRYRASGHRNNS